MRRRVVITGMGAVSPFGEGVEALWSGMRSGRSALSLIPPYQLEGLSCRVAGLVPPVEEKRLPRALRRTMSPMSVHAVLAAEEALRASGLGAEDARDMGVAAGSTLGSPQMMQEFFTSFLTENTVEDVRSTVFFKVMGHTVAANVMLALGCTGRMLAPAAACATGLAAVCMGYEAVAFGREERMLCGGADEFHLLTAATFERLGAASLAQKSAGASRPFDIARSGVVCGEGAGMLLLESLESALGRNAPIFAEVRGSAMTAAPGSIAHPDAAAIAGCMRKALDDAALRPCDIAYVGAHATATVFGDSAEGRAIEQVFGADTPVSSQKGNLGHTMAASGALESILCILMNNSAMFLPTAGLTDPDPACGRIGHFAAPLTGRRGPVLKNAFALGGSNCTVVFDRYSP